MSQDQRCGQDEYDKNGDPPALAITTLDLTDFVVDFGNGYLQCARGIPFIDTNVAQLPVIS